uniref:Ribosomal protein L16 n=1 Tax=Mesostigma viride TaxID=41882 RepID=Q8W9Q4_MESVI|nr:ribosomal protein L16 [Mesostigma viride]AAL36754.1 ribosomal protein L16 [Mesostigma viride]
MKTKYRKYQKALKRKSKGFSGVTTKSECSFGSFGLKSLEAVRLPAQALEAGRRAMTRFLKRQGRIWVRPCPDLPVTTKPLVRMGKGKGSVDFWVARIKVGDLIYEIEGVTKTKAEEAFALASRKLPMSCSYIYTKSD